MTLRGKYCFNDTMCFHFSLISGVYKIFGMEKEIDVLYHNDINRRQI